MKSWTTLYNLAYSFTNAQGASDQTTIKQTINDSIRTIATMRGGKWPWLDTTENVTTTTGATYEIPDSLRKISSLYVQIGNTNPVIYTPTPIFDPDKWNRVLASRLGTSDVPLYYRVQNRQFTLAPTPSTAGNTIVLQGRLNVKDLSIDDYTTGNITTATNAGTTIVGSGTSWTADMAGRYLRITETSAAGGGDELWYQIASVTNATTLVLQKPYEGTSLAASSASYAIGQMSPLPESYDVAPVYRACALYFNQKGAKDSAALYWRLYDGGKEAGLIPATAAIGGIVGQMLEEASETVEGAYISPQDLMSLNPNVPPRYPLTGF